MGKKAIVNVISSSSLENEDKIEKRKCVGKSSAQELGQSSPAPH